MHSTMQRYKILRLPKIRKGLKCVGTSTHYICRERTDAAWDPTYIK